MTFQTDTLTQQIIACIIRVHQVLGPGFKEKVYLRALLLELRANGLSVEIQKVVRIYYRQQCVGEHCLDLLVEGVVIIELKTVEALGKAQYAQVRSYLKATGLVRGLLVNFSGERADIRRVTGIRPVTPPFLGDVGDVGDADSSTHPSS